MSEPRRFSARLVVTGDGPPVHNGIVEVADGIITDIFPGPDNSATDLGNIVLLPGLVNAHTHLEFSTITQPLAANNGMAAWIGAVTDSRRQRTSELDPIRIGLQELNKAGTAAVGEIATADWNSTRLRPDDPTCVVFREIIALQPDRHDHALDTANNFLAQPATPGCLRGLSPHAPYSVHPNLYNDLVQLAARHDVPLATHLAESPDELELLAHGSGPMRQRLESLGAWHESAIPPATRPLDYLVPLAPLQHALVIHGNLLDHDEINWLGQHTHVTVVFCPRTHAHFRLPPHPWPRLLEQGTPVALGTDSRASNPDLSIWNELQFLARHTNTIPADDLLAMATTTPAAALGIEHDCGSLAPGKQATALGLQPDPNTPLTLTSLLERGRIAGVLRRGRWQAA